MTDTTTNAAAAAYHELRERMLDGDDAVTPAALAKAKDVAEHAALLAEADRRRAEREAAEQLERDRDAWRQEVASPLRAQLAELQAQYSELVAMLRGLLDGIDQYSRARRAARATARRLGILDEHDALPELDRDRIWQAALDEGAGRPRQAPTRRFNAPPRLQRHPLHSDAHAAAVDARLAERFGAFEARRTAERAARAADARQKVHDPASDALLASLGRASCE
jgi:hypothetical protein